MNYRAELKQEFDNFVKKLLESGFDVLLSRDSKSTYCHFGNDKGIAYFQASDYFPYISFSTTHYPCHECGTGFRLDFKEAMPTIEQAHTAVNTLAPLWASQRERRAVKKYANLEAYANSSEWIKTEFYIVKSKQGA
jgi:hypothetical protein